MGFLREPSHLIIVALVILVLFGGKKLPEASRGLARSMRIFKSEMKEMRDDDKPGDVSSGATSSTTVSATGPLEGRVVGTGEAGVPPVREPEPIRTPDERRAGL